LWRRAALLNLSAKRSQPFPFKCRAGIRGFGYIQHGIGIVANARLQLGLYRSLRKDGARILGDVFERAYHRISLLCKVEQELQFHDTELLQDRQGIDSRIETGFYVCIQLVNAVFYLVCCRSSIGNISMELVKFSISRNKLIE
jgi:hypothetical protein